MYHVVFVVPVFQSAFAFNRAKKVLDHFNLLAGSKIHRGYGSMGKAKESFYALFNNLPPHIVEHLKNAMVWDSRISKSMKSGQSLFPDRHGREPAPEEGGMDARSRKKKREHSELEEVSDWLSSSEGCSIVLVILFSWGHLWTNILSLSSPHWVQAVNGTATKTDGVLADQLSTDGDLPSPVISAVESEERIRSIKAARLADAVAHPSFQTLSADQQHVIKELWVQSLVGSTTII